MGKKADKKKAKSNGASTNGVSHGDESSESRGRATVGTSAEDGAASGGSGEPVPQEAPRSTLEYRREKLQARTRALEVAEQEVSRLEQGLDHTARVTREQESSLAAASARVAALEQALMASHQERAGLQAALEGVRTEVDRARERLATAERKYDKAVLEEVVRREKAVDLALHAT